MTISPKQKLWVALALVLLLGLIGPSLARGGTAGARWALGGLGAAGLVAWFWRRRGGGEAAPAQSLRVLSRAGLSARTALALVEADGRRYLVAHGEGFAVLREARPPRLRRPKVVARPAAHSSLRKEGLQ